jgi:hypothetical protein
VTNERAKALFNDFAIECEAEPNWIEGGQKPDFFCTGRDVFWCEIKTLSSTNDDQSLFDAHKELRIRAEKISLPGKAFAWVGGKFDHRDAKAFMYLLERALKRFGDSDSPDKLVVIVPDDPIQGEFVRFSVSTKDCAKVEIHSCVSSTGRYEHPHDILPEPYDQKTRLQFSFGEEMEVFARNALALRDNFRVAAEVSPDDRPFRFIATAPTGLAKKSRNPERIREAVAEANNQFKNAVKYREVPCLLMIFHDGLDVPDERIIISALYGDLKYSFSPERFEDGKLIVDRNGAWNPHKNRTTSALMYVRNGAPPLVIHNHWAERPFPPGIFLCKEIVPLDDGTFQEIENSPS